MNLTRGDPFLNVFFVYEVNNYDRDRCGRWTEGPQESLLHRVDSTFLNLTTIQNRRHPLEGEDSNRTVYSNGPKIHNILVHFLFHGGTVSDVPSGRGGTAGRTTDTRESEHTTTMERVVRPSVTRDNVPPVPSSKPMKTNNWYPCCVS